jgi:hypothetical protein
MNMTNTDTRSTLKTGFINNTKWTYNEEIATDIVKSTLGDTVVNTSIAYTTAIYVVLKYETVTLEYSSVTYPTLISSYSYLNPKTGMTYSAVRINLPSIASSTPPQQTIPITGTWSVKLYNYREEQRQSLSTALRPKADF